MGRTQAGCRRRVVVVLAAMASLLGAWMTSPMVARAGAASHGCPSDLSKWKAILGAAWLDCNQLADLTTTGNPYTDPDDLTGMGSPPNSTSTSSGTLNSKY